jgi:MoxR-like ATPase
VQGLFYHQRVVVAPHSCHTAVRCINILQVAAYCNGRDTVTEYDALLLQHVLWQRPEQSERIADWIIAQLSVDDGLKQV